MNNNCSTLTNLNSFRNSGLFCDVKLVSKDGREFLAHKNILAANSWFFRKVFTGFTSDESEEINNKTVVIEFDDIESDLLTIVLNFFYEQNVPEETLHVEIVLNLVSVASFLYSNKLLNFCCEKLISLLNYRNAFQIWNVANKFWLFDLSSHCRLHILQNFVNIIELSEFEKYFVELPFESVFDLLNDDSLNVNNELDILRCLRNWINFDVKNRSQYFLRLIECIRWEITKDLELCKATVSAQFTNVSFEDVAISCVQIENAFSFSVSRFRLPRDLIFIIGGVKDGDPVNVIEVFDNKSEKFTVWNTAKEFFSLLPRMYHGMVELNNKIYLVGGYTDCDNFNSFCCFDPSTKSVRTLATLIVSRCYVCVAVYHGVIYALGGFDGVNRLASVEKYDMSSNQWSFVAPMSQARNDASAVEMNGFLYAAGGFNCESGVLCSVERYDDSVNKWSKITSMIEPRCGLSLLCVDDAYLIAVGGLGGGDDRIKTEKYDSHLNCWEKLPDMNVARNDFASVVLDNYLYCFGGYDGVDNLNQVERLDLQTYQWENLEPLSDVRTASRACVISCLNNVRDFVSSELN